MPCILLGKEEIYSTLQIWPLNWPWWHTEGHLWFLQLKRRPQICSQGGHWLSQHWKKTTRASLHFTSLFTLTHIYAFLYTNRLHVHAPSFISNLSSTLMPLAYSQFKALNVTCKFLRALNRFLFLPTTADLSHHLPTSLATTRMTSSSTVVASALQNKLARVSAQWDVFVTWQIKC